MDARLRGLQRVCGEVGGVPTDDKLDISQFLLKLVAITSS